MHQCHGGRVRDFEVLLKSRFHTPDAPRGAGTNFKHLHPALSIQHRPHRENCTGSQCLIDRTLNGATGVYVGLILGQPALTLDDAAGGMRYGDAPRGAKRCEDGIFIKFRSPPLKALHVRFL